MPLSTMSNGGEMCPPMGNLNNNEGDGPKEK